MTPALLGWFVGLGVVALALCLLLFREVLLVLVDWNCPQCCICSRRVSRSTAWTQRWSVVEQYPAEYCRGPECYPAERRRFTTPWLCPDCAREGWTAESVLLPEDQRP